MKDIPDTSDENTFDQNSLETIDVPISSISPDLGVVAENETESKTTDDSANDDQSTSEIAQTKEDVSQFIHLDDVLTYFGQSSTVEQTDPILIPTGEKRPFLAYEETIDIPPFPEAQMLKYSKNFPNLDMERNATTAEWGQAFTNSIYHTPTRDRFVSSLKNKDAKFVQKVMYEGKALAPGMVNLSSTPHDKLVGEQAVLWVKSVTGQGGIVQIPLWHSGFWVSIKTPSDLQILELNRRIADEKITLGRQTYGLAFTNNMVFTTAHIMNFVFDHLFDHSVKDVGDIRPYVSIHDIHLLAWGIACAIWKNGFQYTRSIVNEDGSIGKTIKALLAVPKMNFTNTNGLTDWQKSHMAGRHGRNMTLSSIEKYRDEFKVGRSRVFKVSEDDPVEFELGVPTMNDYFVAGQKWVNFLTSKVEQAMQVTLDDGRRNEEITQFGKASLMRQYSHWIKSITVSGRTFSDTDTIEQLLDSFSASVDYRRVYFEEIGKFIDDTVVSMMAVPAVIGVDDLNTKTRFPYLVPIDPLATFFTLLVQKTRLIRVRN